MADDDFAPGWIPKSAMDAVLQEQNLIQESEIAELERELAGKHKSKESSKKEKKEKKKSKSGKKKDKKKRKSKHEKKSKEKKKETKSSSSSSSSSDLSDGEDDERKKHEKGSGARAQAAQVAKTDVVPDHSELDALLFSSSSGKTSKDKKEEGDEVERAERPGFLQQLQTNAETGQVKVARPPRCLEAVGLTCLPSGWWAVEPEVC